MTDSFRTLEHVMPTEAAPLQRLVERNWPPSEPVAYPEGVAIGLTAYAEVNHSRWIVRCLFCPGAQLASFVDQRFFCVDCLHASEPAAVGLWVTVEWPENREELEGLLAVRPEKNRNWSLGQSAMDLLIENAQYGLGISESEV